MRKIVTYDGENKQLYGLWANETSIFNLETISSWRGERYIIEDGRVVGHEEEIRGVWNCIELIVDRIKSAISRRIHRTRY